MSKQMFGHNCDYETMVSDCRSFGKPFVYSWRAATALQLSIKTSDELNAWMYHFGYKVISLKSFLAERINNLSRSSYEKYLQDDDAFAELSRSVFVKDPDSMANVCINFGRYRGVLISIANELCGMLHKVDNIRKGGLHLNIAKLSIHRIEALRFSEICGRSLNEMLEGLKKAKELNTDVEELSNLISDLSFTLWRLDIWANYFKIIGIRINQLENACKEDKTDDIDSIAQNMGKEIRQLIASIPDIVA